MARGGTEESVRVTFKYTEDPDPGKFAVVGAGEKDEVGNDVQGKRLGVPQAVYVELSPTSTAANAVEVVTSFCQLECVDYCGKEEPDVTTTCMLKCWGITARKLNDPESAEGICEWHEDHKLSLFCDPAEQYELEMNFDVSVLKKKKRCCC